MPRIILMVLCHLLFSAGVLGQVGIGTTSVDASALLQLESTTSAFVLPRLTDAQMTAVPNPPTGSMIFNSSENLPYFKGDVGWSGFDINSNPTIILTKSGGNLLTSTTSSYPINVSAANVLSTSSAYFTVDAPGAITVNRPGVYLMSACIATSNMPSGSRKYHLALYRNGGLISYLSKSKLESTSSDYWGMTGTLMYYLEAGDQLYFRYFISNTTTLANVFQTICITKLN